MSQIGSVAVYSHTVMMLLMPGNANDPEIHKQKNTPTNTQSKHRVNTKSLRCTHYKQSYTTRDANLRWNIKEETTWSQSACALDACFLRAASLCTQPDQRESRTHLHPHFTGVPEEKGPRQHFSSSPQSERVSGKCFGNFSSFGNCETTKHSDETWLCFGVKFVFSFPNSWRVFSTRGHRRAKPPPPPTGPRVGRVIIAVTPIRKLNLVISWPLSGGAAELWVTKRFVSVTFAWRNNEQPRNNSLGNS